MMSMAFAGDDWLEMEPSLAIKHKTERVVLDKSWYVLYYTKMDDSPYMLFHANKIESVEEDKTTKNKIYKEEKEPEVVGRIKFDGTLYFTQQACYTRPEHAGQFCDLIKSIYTLKEIIYDHR